LFRARDEKDSLARLAAFHLGRLRAGAMTQKDLGDSGAVFLQAERVSMRFNNRVIDAPNGKILTHEIGHLILGAVHDLESTASVMTNGRHEAGNLLQKRLSKEQARRASRFLKPR
jgi:hypothetical protein